MSFIETESVEMFAISMMSTLHMFIQLTLGYACHTWPRNRELLVYLCLWHDWYFRYPRVYFSFLFFKIVSISRSLELHKSATGLCLLSMKPKNVRMEDIFDVENLCLLCQIKVLCPSFSTLKYFIKSINGALSLE